MIEMFTLGTYDMILEVGGALGAAQSTPPIFCIPAVDVLPRYNRIAYV